MSADSGIDGFPIACVGGGTPGTFFVQRLLAHTNMPLSLATVFLSTSERSRQLVSLGPEFHGDLEFWRWIVEAGTNASEGGLFVPMYRLVARSPRRT